MRTISGVAVGFYGLSARSSSNLKAGIEQTSNMMILSVKIY
jgi:hypothetical protein